MTYFLLFSVFLEGKNSQIFLMLFSLKKFIALMLTMVRLMKRDNLALGALQNSVLIAQVCKYSYAGLAPCAIFSLYSLLSSLNIARFSGSHRDFDCMFGRLQNEKWEGWF